MRITRRRGRNINSVWCPKCGARNPINTKYCRICATKIEPETPIDEGKKK